MKENLCSVDVSFRNSFRILRTGTKGEFLLLTRHVFSHFISLEFRFSSMQAAWSGGPGFSSQVDLPFMG